MRHLYLGTLFAFLIIASCRSDQGRVYWVDEARKVEGALSGVDSSVDLKNYILNIINPEGKRTLAQDFTISEQGAFQFTLDNEFILDDKFYTKAEEFVSMGDIKYLPSQPEKVKSIVRLELRPSSIADITGEVSYLQLVLPLVRSDLLMANSELLIGQSMSFYKVAFHKVKILDSKGTPIPNANVLPIVHGTAARADNPLAPAWTADLFRPIIHVSGNDGVATLIPLAKIDENSTYSVMAWADGYCTYVTPPLLIKDTTIPEITLKSCPQASEDAFGLVAEYTASTLLYDEVISVASELQKVAYTSGDKLSFRIDSLSPKIRGLKYKFTEGHGADGPEHPNHPAVDMGNSPVFATKFQSRIDIDLPAIFQTNQSTDGDLTFHFTTDLKDNNEAVVETSTVFLYARRKKTKPSLAFMNDLKIKSFEEDGVISGVTGSIVTVTTKNCADLEEMGLKTNGTTTVFKRCQNNKATFKVEELLLPGFSSQIGGSLAFRIFKKDKYLNVNDDDLIDRNVKNIFVDYGTPDLDTKPLFLGINLGFTYSTESKGTSDSPYVFPSGSLQGSQTDTVIISASNLSNIVFRFASPDECQSNSGGQKDGIIQSETGVKIKKFQIANTSENINTNSMILCADQGQASDWPVGENDITFPASTTENATFVLSVVDLAGNQSVAHTYEIPPCPAQVETTPGTLYCWTN